ncbi:MAG: hypothetical protein ACPIOQ_51845, partial [Promethearchaeia archaeon]
KLARNGRVCPLVSSKLTAEFAVLMRPSLAATAAAATAAGLACVPLIDAHDQALNCDRARCRVARAILDAELYPKVLGTLASQRPGRSPRRRAVAQAGLHRMSRLQSAGHIRCWQYVLDRWAAPPPQLLCSCPLTHGGRPDRGGGLCAATNLPVLEGGGHVPRQRKTQKGGAV